MRWLDIRSWRSVTAAGALVCLVAACGGGKDGPTGPGGGGGNGNVAGDYLLASADGDGLPAVVESDGCSAIQVLNGGLTLSEDGTFQMQFNWQDQDGAQFTGDHGSYRARNGQLEFTSEAWGDSFKGEADGGSVQVAWDFCGDTPGDEMDLGFSR